MNFDFSREPGGKLEKENIIDTNGIVPKVSIVTPFYNAGAYFEQTYNCVLNQTMSEFEWIIVNDGSTKQEDVKRLERLALTDVRIKVLHQENGGQSKAKNYAISKANTDTIIFLDADDLIEPYYVQILYKALEMHPNASWSYTDLVGFAGQEYVWCKTFSAGRMTFNNILVNAAAFRKSAIVAVGGFPEVTKHYDEDWALYLKLLGERMYPVHVPVIGFWYRKSDTGMQQTVRKNEELRIESDKYIKKLAQDVDVRIMAEMYRGMIPTEAVTSSYSFIDRLMARIMNVKWGAKLFERLYLCRK